MRCDAEGSRKRRLITPISEGFLGRSMSKQLLVNLAWLPHHERMPYEPSMSAGLSRSMRRMRPVERARTRTLLATAAATKSEDMENCSDTRSILNIGSDAPSCALLVLGGA